MYYEFIIILALLIVIGSCVVVASMAKKRGRSVVGWVIFSFFVLPLAIILLLCLGETDEKRKERLEEEALIQWRVWDRQNSKCGINFSGFSNMALIQWQVWDRQNRLKEKENEAKKQEEHRTHS